MLCYSLQAGVRREVLGCNHNLHVGERHPDRVMSLHDLIYIVSGEWEIWQDEVAYSIGSGDVLLLQAGHRHYGLKPCAGEVRTMFIHFSACESDAQTDSILARPDRYSFPAISHVPQGSPIPKLFDRVITNYWQRDVYAPERAGDYLSLALCELSLLGAGAHANADEGELVRRLIQTMEMNPERFYSVDELSAMIHVSDRTLHNYFVRATGMSPRAYQIASKLDAARQTMQAEPKARLRELAARYGFCDEYHFSKLYRARFGRPPKSDK